MATEGTQIVANLIAGENLSAKQYFVVAPNGSQRQVAAATDTEQPMPIGILMNAPTASMAAEVCVYGIAKMKVNTVTDVASGDLLTLDGSFLGAVQTGASSLYFARAMEPATTGCPIITVLWLGNEGFVGDTVA